VDCDRNYPMHSDVIIKDMTSETPKKPWERTREEKLHDIVQDLESKLESLEDVRGAILEVQPLFLPGGIFAEARAYAAKEHDTYKNALVEMIDQCARIQKSANPRDEVRRMAEILIQRESDPEWSSAGINEDSRLLLFNMYFDTIKEGVHYEGSLKILQKIKDCQSDDSFFDDVASKIGEIKRDLEWHYDWMIRKERRNAESPITDAAILAESLGLEEEPVVAVKKPQMTLDQRLADIDRKIAIIRERIKRLSVQK